MHNELEKLNNLSDNVYTFNILATRGYEVIYTLYKNAKEVLSIRAENENLKEAMEAGEEYFAFHISNFYEQEKFELAMELINEHLKTLPDDMTIQQYLYNVLFEEEEEDKKVELRKTESLEEMGYEPMFDEEDVNDGVFSGEVSIGSTQDWITTSTGNVASFVETTTSGQGIDNITNQIMDKLLENGSCTIYLSL